MWLQSAVRILLSLLLFAQYVQCTSRNYRERTSVYLYLNVRGLTLKKLRRLAIVIRSCESPRFAEDC